MKRHSHFTDLYTVTFQNFYKIRPLGLLFFFLHNAKTAKSEDFALAGSIGGNLAGSGESARVKPARDYNSNAEPDRFEGNLPDIWETC